ncbi:Spc98 family-domain-containing protein [Chlamydoabsidia padenii]|nr:Spc98 family-domain-containing protein [Chlamydoabsidia padenii]
MMNPKNSAKALKFGHLYNKLDSQQVLVKKWSILYLLHLLSDPKGSAPSTPLKRDASQFLSSGLQSHDTSPSPQTEESPRIRRRLTHDRSLPAALQLAHARQETTPPSTTTTTTTTTEGIVVPEAYLLRDLIYIFQGIDGQYITFDPINNEYVLDTHLSVPKPTQDLIYRLTELGWLYQRVQKFINTHFAQLSMGLVGQSFCSALQSELMEFYKLIAILEAQIEKQIQPDTDFIPSEQSLTLKRLLVWTQESLQRLKWMDVLVDMGQDQKGGALVSIMHSYTNHGDPNFKQYVSEMLQEVSKPFYEMLKRWISEGELDDPYGEFFVAIDPSVTEEELWQRKYTLRADMLPPFISPELAQKIFSIGKSLNFIRYSCHDETLVEKYYAENSTTLPWHTFKYGDMQTIELCVDTMYLETSNQLLALLKDKYKLMDHLRALKRYLLLGQGDFIQYLMVTLGPALNRPANTLYRHNLTGVLETAIRASNAQFDEPAILNRLDVRILEVGTQDLGWDVFTLDYHVDSPINTVLSPPMMNQYLRVFNFLWRLKRVEYTLSEAWRRWGTASRTFASIPELSQDLHEAQLMIARMIHFIYQLQHYYLFEVLEYSWEKLETRINTKSIDLDAVIEAHAQYLYDIAHKGFLTGLKAPPLSMQLNSIFDVILTYKTILDLLHGYATSELTKRLPHDTEKLTKLRSRLNGVSSHFKSLVQEFLKASMDLGYKIIK